jgi:hypothetical protein
VAHSQQGPAHGQVQGAAAAGAQGEPGQRTGPSQEEARQSTEAAARKAEQATQLTEELERELERMLLERAAQDAALDQKVSARQAAEAHVASVLSRLAEAEAQLSQTLDIPPLENTSALAGLAILPPGLGGGGGGGFSAPSFTAPDVLTYMLIRLEELGALSTDGIVRISGASTEVAALLRVVETADHDEIWRTLSACADVHAVASLLRAWLRARPPLVQPASYPAFERLASLQPTNASGNQAMGTTHIS